jgi:formylglycine-generating enzyme required for sulfatase activity
MWSTIYDSEVIRIPEGWCWIGSEGRYDWESPRHRVFLEAFEIAPTTVRRREYSEFLQATAHAEPRDWHLPAFADPDQPVVGVSWFDTVEYCRWFSETSGVLYRLPTEAEWEKACRGGNDDIEYSWGNDPPEVIARYQSAWTSPQPASEGTPNGYGLFHMGDNVHEWCLDWYSPNYYAISPERNPPGPESGTRRVSRGGSWRHLVKGSRAAHRSSLPPSFRYADYGFRLVRDIVS